MISYIATIHKELESDYGVQFYDFPGCIIVGKTIEEAKIMANEVLTGHLEMILNEQEEISQPSSLEKILGDADQDDAVAFVIINISNDIFSRQSEQAVSMYLKVSTVDELPQ